MTIRVLYSNEVYIDHEDVEEFSFHRDFLVLYLKDGSTHFVNISKIQGFRHIADTE